jgi:hypothetical protein
MVAVSIKYKQFSFLSFSYWLKLSLRIAIKEKQEKPAENLKEQLLVPEDFSTRRKA